MLRNPDGPWLPKRVSSLLKYKPFSDDEGTVVGFTSGRKTDKGSKLLGMIGSLILDYRGKRLELAGLTNEERTFLYDEYSAYAAKFPGQDMPNNFKGKHLTMTGYQKTKRLWRRSFYCIFKPRYVLTPFAIAIWSYEIGFNYVLIYKDVYIFGLRVARLTVK
jgi:hypothetical protein